MRPYIAPHPAKLPAPGVRAPEPQILPLRERHRLLHRHPHRRLYPRRRVLVRPAHRRALEPPRGAFVGRRRAAGFAGGQDWDGGPCEGLEVERRRGRGGGRERGRGGEGGGEEGVEVVAVGAFADVGGGDADGVHGG
eukprot:CAMPEP_0174905822 /NCGR_PEP_ID=MMETSP0167-20121228/54425_1 /TAXON_ID=38298 /ORGANISM="Rhodella maculata, Strain CCMP736" /LENGTH=136 /DNA_ID=CAMNT_0016148893 /DNA_START=635 /DNA_END=1041 /DNA_ORIENTATION=+